MPTQIRKPKQKIAVEGAVGNIATHLIAELRHQTFTDFETLKQAVFNKLEAYNHQPFQKREGSRYLVFQSTEQEKLRPLPSTPFEIAEWVYRRKVQLDAHINFQSNTYSVPYQYIRKYVDLKVTKSHLEIYYHQERIATHKRFPAYQKYQRRTLPEHLPDFFNQPEWPDERRLQRAEEIGPYVLKVI
ncbi:Mu transposase domain-containing protein [Suicoccus acidiformans]|uniref:Mu transposase domain-containing protein n=1 Tax=Suicoccus acidiformans TaxID=2036206 RepID=UPI0019692A71|nr:hypothetical protein [Suicoccus acidiformans]